MYALEWFFTCFQARNSKTWNSLSIQHLKAKMHSPINKTIKIQCKNYCLMYIYNVYLLFNIANEELKMKLTIAEYHLIIYYRSIFDCNHSYHNCKFKKMYIYIKIY